MPEETTQTTQTAQPQANSQAGAGQQGSDLASQASQIHPRNANEVDLSRISGSEASEDDKGKAAAAATATAPAATQTTQTPDIKELIRTNPELARMAQQAAEAAQLRQRMSTLQPYEADIRKIMEQRQNEARNKGDLSADFNRVFGDEYGGPVMNLISAFLESKMGQQLEPVNQRLQGVEGSSRGIAINGTCDTWYEKLRVAMKDDGKAKELIQATLADLHARNTNFSPNELENAIAMRVSQLYTQQQTTAPAAQPAGGTQQGGAQVSSTQAAQRLVPSAAEAQRRIDGGIEGGQQAGAKMDAGDQIQQEQDRLLRDYSDWIS